jgi:hypothetical protein
MQIFPPVETYVDQTVEEPDYEEDVDVQKEGEFSIKEHPNEGTGRQLTQFF